MTRIKTDSQDPPRVVELRPGERIVSEPSKAVDRVERWAVLDSIDGEEYHRTPESAIARSEPLLGRVVHLVELRDGERIVSEPTGDRGALRQDRERLVNSLRNQILALPWAVTGGGTRIVGAVERSAVVAIIDAARQAGQPEGTA